MDISEFDTQTNSENGMWFQPVIYGRRMPLELCIVGSDSDEVMKFNRKQLKKLNIKKANLDDIDLDDDTIDELSEANKESVIRRVIDIRAVDKKGKVVDEPIVLNGKTITKAKEDIRFLIDAIPELEKFILNKSNERENFLADRKKN